MKSWVFRTIIGLLALIGAAVAYIAVLSLYWQIVVGGPLSKEFGFELGTPYIVEDGSSSLIEVLAIESGLPRARADRARVR